MKCPKCGYNSFDSLNECKRCGARVEIKKPGTRPERPRKSTKVHDDIENFSLFESEEPVLLEDELVDEYSFHGAVPKPASSDVNTDLSESYLELAGFTRRALAFFLDVSVIISISFLTIFLGLLASGMQINEGIIKLSYILLPVFVILCLLASTLLFFLHAYSGKSFGKLVFGLRVVSEDGSNISVGQSFSRWVGYYMSALPLFYGYISALFDFNFQAWHDKISRTFVVKDS